MFRQPTDELRSDHELVLLVVEAMEYEAASILRSGAVHEERVMSMTRFTRDFTDACHQRKEEEVLLPVLLARRHDAADLVRTLEDEHAAGRDAIWEVEAALHSPTGDGVAVARELAVYARLLHGHVAREDNVLLPLAEWALRGQEPRFVAQEFARIDAEQLGPTGYERYVELANELVRLPAAA